MKIRKDYLRKYDSWTGILGSRPFVIPLTELLAKTLITPNLVTILSFVISLGAVYLFYSGNLFVGAIIWQVGFIFDNVDGCLARKLKKTSDFGAKLDQTLDKIKKFLAIIVVIYSIYPQYNLTIIVLLILTHYLLHRVSYKRNDNLIKFFNSKGIKSFFDPLDEQFFILFLGPLTGYVFQLLISTIVLQILNIFIHLVCNRFNFHKEIG